MASNIEYGVAGGQFDVMIPGVGAFDEYIIILGNSKL